VLEQYLTEKYGCEKMPGQTIRRVLQGEYSKYRDHLKALDAESRTLRFANPVADLVIDRFCDGVEAKYYNHILFAVEDSDLNFIAVGHIALEEGRKMELAFSVHKDYQGQGLGNRLMARCIQWCRIHGYLEGSMVCLRSNSKIRHLCRKYGITVENEYDEALADIKLAPADFGAYLGETVDTQLGVWDYWSKRALSKPSLLF